MVTISCSCRFVLYRHSIGIIFLHTPLGSWTAHPPAFQMSVHSLKRLRTQTWKICLIRRLKIEVRRRLHFQCAEWAPVACPPVGMYPTRFRGTVESVMDNRVRCNASSAQSRHWVSARVAAQSLLYSGKIPVMLVPWDTANILGHSRGNKHGGPWERWPDHRIDQVADNTMTVKSGGRVSYVPNLHRNQREFITGFHLVLYNPGAATTV